MTPAQILVVEDESIVALDLRNKLQRLGYAVPTPVDSGEDAVEAALQRQPDLVLMDIQLKGAMDGIEAANLIRDRLKIPIIYLTAYADPQTLEQARVTRPSGYLVKPFEDSELHAVIEMALVKHQSELALQKAKEELEARVSERTAELAQANRRLRAEMEEGKRQEERLKIMFELAPDAYYLSDTKGTLVDGNRAAQELVGYAKEELIGKSFLHAQLLPKGQIPKAVTLLARNALGKPTGPDEFTLIRKDGAQVPVEIRTYPIHFDGQTLVLGIARDITVRKREAEALRQRNLMLEMLTTLSQAVSLTLEVGPILDTVAKFANDAIGATSAYVCGWDEERCESVTLAEFYSPEASERERVSDLGFTYQEEEAFADWIRDARAYFIDHVDDPDRSLTGTDYLAKYGAKSVLGVPIVAVEKPVGFIEVWESRRKRHFSEHEIELVQAIAQHVSMSIENARLFEETQKRLAELASLWDVGAAVAGEFTSEQVFDLVVRSAAELTGAEGASICLLQSEGRNRQHVACFGDLTAKLCGRVEEAGAGLHGVVLTQGEPLLVPEVQRDARVTRLGREMGIQRAIIAPLRAKGRIIGALSAFGQRPEHRFSRHDLRLLVAFADYAAIAIRNARLHETVRSHAVDLEMAAEELREANARLQALSRVKDEFVSNVSHELRSPITSLKLYQQMLLDHPENLETYLDTMQRETDRLERIIEDLLHLSRMDQGYAEWDSTPVRLEGFVGPYVADRIPLAESRNLKLALEIEPDVPVVQADEGMLGQALGILLTNALNYTPPGGEVLVRVAAQRQNGKVWGGFSVRDTGPGIAPDEQTRLFQRFFRGQAGRQSRISGTGLGLALAKEIVDRHGGRIEVDSEGIPGQGATFSIWLPAELGAPSLSRPAV